MEGNRIDATLVEVTCISKKESKNWSGDPNKYPKAFEIELEVPYDPNSIYHKLSGGTNIPLRTINPDAASMFNIGEKYKVTISRLEKEEKGE